LFGIGKAACIVGAKINNETDYGAWLVGKAKEPQPASLNQTCQLIGWTRQQPSCGRREVDPVVGDQPSKAPSAVLGGLDEFESKARLTGSGRPANEQAARADKHTGSMHAGQLRRHYDAGRRTTKRAPATVAAPSASAGPTRFSTQMAPPCA